MPSIFKDSTSECARQFMRRDSHWSNRPRPDAAALRGCEITLVVKIVVAWRRRDAERRAGQGHTRPTRAARLSAEVMKCPSFRIRQRGHGVKGSADFSPQRVVGGMELGRTCDVLGEAECCGLKVRAPQTCGAAMPSVVMKAARHTQSLTSGGFIAAIGSFIEILSFGERPLSPQLNPVHPQTPCGESDSSTIDCG